MQYIVIFIVEAVITMFGTRKFKYIAQDNKLMACIYTFILVLIFGMSLLIIIKVQDLWTVLAMSLGGVIGTYFGMSGKRESNMRSEIKNKSELIVEETIERIQRQVRIPSVEVKGGEEGTLFGKNVQAALEDYLKQCEEIGLETYIASDGKYGYAEWGTKEQELFAILGHVDVVPEGDHAQWTSGGPFSGDVIDGKIIGRGSLDDKGPMVINLMAIKALKELGFNPSKRIRLIVGANEESGFACMNAYVKEQEIPAMSYTPDANFPCIFGEKTILQFDARNNHENDFTIIAGAAYNAVCDRATYKGSKINELKDKLNEHNFEFEEQNESISVVGKSAHAMMTESGINAISRLVICLFEIGEHSPAIDFIYENIKETYFGELWVGNVEDKESGKLKLNVAQLHIDGMHEFIGFDSRIPVLVNSDEVTNQYKEKIESAGFTWEVHDLKPRLYVAKDTELVKTILTNYEEVTGEYKQPLTSGGGTYARSFDNCVAFGAVFEGMLDLMHQPNECFEIKYIQPALELYMKTIYDLTK